MMHHSESSEVCSRTSSRLNVLAGGAMMISVFVVCVLRIVEVRFALSWGEWNKGEEERQSGTRDITSIIVAGLSKAPSESSDLVD